MAATLTCTVRLRATRTKLRAGRLKLMVRGFMTPPELRARMRRRGLSMCGTARLPRYPGVTGTPSAVSS
jgi:hypothetical protein